MIKIITTVGTSMLTNYMKKEVKDALANSYIDIYKSFEVLIKNNPKSCYKYDKDNIFKTIKDLWLKDIEKDVSGNWNITNKDVFNFDASAEIKTIMHFLNKIDKTKEEIDIYLITTDTIVSNLSAELIKEFFTEYKEQNAQTKIKNVYFDINKDCIKGLNVINYYEFNNKGFINLINRVNEIYNENTQEKKNVKTILNISGGYKALIPFMTILGQINKIPIIYIYEDSNELIDIAKLPISFDRDIAELCYPYLQNNSQIPKEAKIIEDYIDEYSLGKIQNHKVSLTAIGNMVKDFVDKQDPLAKSVMGHFIEYKLYEYYIDNNFISNGVTYSKIKHSKKKTKTINDTTITLCEYDLFMEGELNGKNHIIIGEIKPWFGIKKHIFEIIGQINKQIQNLSQDEIEALTEYHLYIYTPINNIVLSDQEIIDNLKKIKQISIFQNEKVILRIFIVDLSQSFKTSISQSNSNNNYYDEFIKNPIQSNQLKEIQI